MKTGLGLLVVGLATFLVACGGETEPASNIQPTSATLNVKGRCAFEASGTWRFQYRALPSGSWQNGPAHGFACPPGSGSTTNVPLPSDNITGLTPGTTYEFRVAADIDPQEGNYAWADSLGAINGTDYDTFTTPEACDDTQGASETLDDFIDSNPAGTAGNRQVLCVRGGTQDIGQVSVTDAYQTIRGPSENLLNGNIALNAQGATLEDLRVAGCRTSPGCTASLDKTIDVKANDITLRRVDITQQGGRGAQIMQCVLMGSASVRVSGFRAEYSRFHGCGTDHPDQSIDDHYHGIYCSNASSPTFVGNWLYDNEGWGFHLYPDCDDAQVVGNVNAQNGLGCALSGEPDFGVSSDGVDFQKGFCGFALEVDADESDVPIHCFGGGNGTATDMILYDPDRGSFVTDCASSLSQTNTLNADPAFVNRTGFDFRVTASGARDRMRQYSDNQPGPRW
jgi:hypothetical protein